MSEYLDQFKTGRGRPKTSKPDKYGTAGMPGSHHVFMLRMAVDRIAPKLDACQKNQLKNYLVSAAGSFSALRIAKQPGNARGRKFDAATTLLILECGAALKSVAGQDAAFWVDHEGKPSQPVALAAACIEVATGRPPRASLKHQAENARTIKSQLQVMATK